MPRLTASAPMILVTDVRAAADYWRDKLGFDYKEVYGQPVADFCIVHRDGQYLMLARTDDAAKVQPIWRRREKTSDAYFWCDDADGLHAEMAGRGATIDYGPCTQPYGVREFGVRTPDGHDISFGQVL
ncbi:MAG TPA: VOC family protein [Tepidisphaeraceae bacterium]|nr:VOC family protein [Tepidisphaeraceae bacterium]